MKVNANAEKLALTPKAHFLSVLLADFDLRLSEKALQYVKTMSLLVNKADTPKGIAAALAQLLVS